jgi:hypothetical protein
MKRDELLTRLRLTIVGLDSNDCDFATLQFYVGELEEIEQALLAERAGK